MRFSVYEPPQARERRVPVLYYLAGLTCSEETFRSKRVRSGSPPNWA
jgi:S-formylglutathione hydrolase